MEEQFRLIRLQELRIKTQWKVYGRTEPAIVNLPVEAAVKLLAAGRVKTGWALCWLREQMALK